MSNDARAEKIKSALGFAMKAGKVRSGELAAHKAVKSGRAKAVVIDEKLSPSSAERWRGICENAVIPLITAEDLGDAIGREAHMVACIVDNGFAQMLLRACQDTRS